MYECKCTSMFKIIFVFVFHPIIFIIDFVKLCVAVEYHKGNQKYFDDLYGLRKTVL